MSEGLGHTALADHCINKPLKSSLVILEIDFTSKQLRYVPLSSGTL